MPDFHLLGSRRPPIFPLVILRFQALFLLLFFVAGSLLGQGQVQLCLCTGALTFTPSGSEERMTCCASPSESCPACPHEEGEQPSPCENGKCVMVLTLPPLDQPVAFQLRDLGSISVDAPSGATLVTPAALPKPAQQRPSARPPDPLRPALRVLYSTYLI